MGIDGNILQLLQNMYQQVQYCVKLNGKVSKPFNSSIGVKQGCVLSPLLFNMYVSDIPDIFDDACHPVTVNSLTTNSMLFADDLVLLSESAEDIQRCLGKLENYCHQWGLTINQDKTKVIIFNKKVVRNQKNSNFMSTILRSKLPNHTATWALFSHPVVPSIGQFLLCMIRHAKHSLLSNKWKRRNIHCWQFHYLINSSFQSWHMRLKSGDHFCSINPSVQKAAP